MPPGTGTSAAARVVLRRIMGWDILQGRCNSRDLESLGGNSHAGFCSYPQIATACDYPSGVAKDVAAKVPSLLV